MTLHSKLSDTKPSSPGYTSVQMKNRAHDRYILSATFEENAPMSPLGKYLIELLGEMLHDDARADVHCPATVRRLPGVVLSVEEVIHDDVNRSTGPALQRVSSLLDVLPRTLDVVSMH